MHGSKGYGLDRVELSFCSFAESCIMVGKTGGCIRGAAVSKEEPLGNLLLLIQLMRQLQLIPVRLLREIHAFALCSRPQAVHLAHLLELLQQLSGCGRFTNPECYGGRSAHTHARWFARPTPTHAWPRPRWGLRIRGPGENCRSWKPVSCPRPVAAHKARAGLGAAWPAPCAGG